MYWTKEKTSAFEQRTCDVIGREEEKRSVRRPSIVVVSVHIRSISFRRRLVLFRK